MLSNKIGVRFAKFHPPVKILESVYRYLLLMEAVSLKLPYSYAHFLLKSTKRYPVVLIVVMRDVSVSILKTPQICVIPTLSWYHAFCRKVQAGVSTLFVRFQNILMYSTASPESVTRREPLQLLNRTTVKTTLTTTNILFINAHYGKLVKH